MQLRFKGIEGYSNTDYYVPIIRYQGEFEQFIKDITAYSNGSTDIKGFAIGDRPPFIDSLRTHTYPYLNRIKQCDSVLLQSRMTRLNELATKYDFHWVLFYLPYSPNVHEVIRPDSLRFNKRQLSIYSFDHLKWSFNDFYDYRHLNEKGASKLSDSLEHKLLQDWESYGLPPPKE